MPHDFKKFPELLDSQLDFYYFTSPHKQIFDGFMGLVTDVHDGDTIRVETHFRDFDTKIRYNNLAAPELNEGGLESKMFMSRLILGQRVWVHIDPDNRVDKWGRLLGRVYHKFNDVGEMAIRHGHGTPWSSRKDGTIEFRKPSISKDLKSAVSA